MSRNLVQLAGNLGRDPSYYEGKEGNDTIGRCTFPLIVDNCHRQKKYSIKVNLIAWGKKATLLMDSVSKGDYLSIEGSLNMRSKANEDGSFRWIPEVVIDKVLEIKKKGL